MARIVEEALNDDDVISIGKLRRPGRPAASITFDPGYGIRVEDMDAPKEPVAAAFWLKKQAGWLRIFKCIPKGHPLVDEFVKACRRNK
jgi:hypothetical protein